GGSIVNISSVAAMVCTAGMTAYCASKAAVRMLTKALAVEFALIGLPIRVNSVHPAFTRTAMVEEILQASGDPARAERKLSRAIPQKRLGEPAEIAGVVIHLLSDESSFTTGAEHIVDGGLTSM
ncbi:MAG: SDR family oxidoreductase, partial [Myxococcales bacterium]|nr:SDR family oxidoreductase [Myxococcales bacterium]